MTGTLFRRKAYDELRRWKARSKGSTAILIEGARSVGKSVLAKEFARNEYASCIVIGLRDAPPEVLRIFDDLNDLDRFFRDLQLFFHTDLVRRDSAIVFDDVQCFPRARQAVKHLVKDGRYDYIETGMFVSLPENVRSILIPSEEEHMTLRPLDFEEFLWAGGGQAFQLLRHYYDRREPVGCVHPTMMKRYREYLAVGGMPEAVSAFVDGKSYREIDFAKRGIVGRVLEDLREKDPGGKLGRLLLSVPSQLSGGATRFRIGDVVPNGRLARESASFRVLEESHAVELCFHDPCPGRYPHGRDYEFFKIYMADTGLLVTLSGYGREFSENGIYGKLATGAPSAELGPVYENAAAQALAAMGKGLQYHTFLKEDGKHLRVIDFFFIEKDRMRPVVSRPLRAKEHSDLDALMSRKRLKIGTPVVVSPMDLELCGGILYLPAYMMQFLDSRSLDDAEPGSAWTMEFDEDDWFSADEAFHLYVKAKDHGKADPSAIVMCRNSKDGVERMDVSVRTDGEGNVMITSKERKSCTVRITESAP